MQPSGLIVKNVASTASPISVNEFFGLNQTGAAPAGTASICSMNGLLGTTSSTELEMFTYASELEARFVIPRANLTGTFYQGKMRLGQFFDEAAKPNPLYAEAVTVNTLIRAADRISSMKDGFTLRSSMVNDYILTHTLRHGDDDLDTRLTDNNLGSEIIDYVVLQTPAINITTGANSEYSLI
jgi:hypothetical protein